MEYYERGQIALLALLLLPFAARTQSIRESADSIRTLRGVPGMAYAVFSGDSILEEEVVGYRAFRSKDTISLQDAFYLGTNTAAVTAYLAARLVEAGKVKWNTSLLKVFPEFKKTAFPVYQSITLADLLACRTRLPPFMSADDWAHIPAGHGNIVSRRKTAAGFLLRQKPDMESFLQKNIVFSQANYVLAAAMLEKITGKSWEDLITQYVRKPLKISIRYSWPLLSDTAAPAGHWSRGGRFHAELANTWVKINPVLYPAQGISLRLADYIRFVRENISGLAGEKAGLSQETFNYLHTGKPDYAMGWNNGTLNDQSFSFHEGISLLFDCRAEILTEKKLGIIVMCNSGDKDGRGAVLDLTRLLEEKYF